MKKEDRMRTKVLVVFLSLFFCQIQILSCNDKDNNTEIPDDKKRF
jgi:hypothetical protein